MAEACDTSAKFASRRATPSSSRLSGGESREVADECRKRGHDKGGHERFVFAFLDRCRDELVSTHLTPKAGDRVCTAVRPTLLDGARARCSDGRPPMGAVGLDEELPRLGGE